MTALTIEEITDKVTILSGIQLIQYLQSLNFLKREEICEKCGLMNINKYKKIKMILLGGVPIEVAKILKFIFQ